MLVLNVIQGPETGKKFELPANEPQMIGRSTEALPLYDNTVSRRHAELTPDGGVWWIRDLDSQNGTYVNGVKIARRMRLMAGDQIRVGSTVFVFGQTDDRDPTVVRVVSPREMDTNVERRMVSNEDSVILAEPEPRAAAMDHLRVIYRLTTLTTQVTDTRKLLESVMDLVFEEFGPERGVVMLSPADPDGEMHAAVVRYQNRPREGEDATIHVSTTILNAAIDQSEGVLSSNAMADPRFAKGDSVQQYNIRSAVCSPIVFQDRTFGAIYIDSSIANYTFTEQQLALLNAIGQHTGLALANADHTLKQLHTERLAAIGETVASLSHSIKNILQGLRGGADLVEMGLKKQDIGISRGGWDILKRNLDRIVALTLNMLAYSRQTQVEPELTKLGALAEDCTELFEADRVERGVALIVDSDPEMPPIPVDPNLLHQAIVNLIGNAMEAVESKTGVVTVRVSYHESASVRGRTGPAVEIAVIDNGPGIEREKLAWIFEPFNSTKGIRGTGLGLAVTKRIIAEHRGKIVVESQPGRGSMFRVFLPTDLGSSIDPSATAENRPSAEELMRGI